MHSTMSDNKSIETISEISDQLFKQLAKCETNFTHSAFLEKFKNAKSDLDKVNFAYNLLQKQHLFPPFLRNEKEDSIAFVHKEEGNKFFASNECLKALKSYTSSISTAKSKDHLALAYANRSACLLKMGMYQECLMDIEMALDSGYPAHLRHKLLGRRRSALEAFKPKEPYHTEIPTIPESQKNKLVQCAKDCVEIKSSQQYGRHVVATRDIKIGEVISVEEPFAAKLFNDKFIHCHGCLKLCYNLIPCPKCTVALFCNETCKERAFSDYHKYECPIIAALLVLKLRIHRFMALKVAVLARQDEFKAEKEDQIYQSNRYKEVHNLIRHAEKIPPIKLFKKAVVAAVIFDVVKNNTDFLKDFKQFEDKFKEVLFGQLLACQINISDVSELVVENSSKCQLLMIGKGLYPFLALFSHSCCNNVDRYFYGRTVVLRATGSIKKGQQCFITYGVDFKEVLRRGRQAYLSSYYFTCTCKACEQDWTKQLLETHIPLLIGRNPLDFLSKFSSLEQGDVNAATNMLDALQQQLKTWERRQPFGCSEMLKDMIFKAYTILGNRRTL